MKYFVLIAGYGERPVWDEMTAEEQAVDLAAHLAFGQACADHAEVEILDGEAFGDGSTATTLRTRDGALIVADGPFAEAADQIGGYVEPMGAVAELPVLQTFDPTKLQTRYLAAPGRPGWKLACLAVSGAPWRP